MSTFIDRDGGKTFARCNVYRTPINQQQCQMACSKRRNAFGPCQNCRSPWRICFACHVQGVKEAVTGVNPKTGFCKFHNEHGPDAKPGSDRPAANLLKRHRFGSADPLVFSYGPDDPRLKDVILGGRSTGQRKGGGPGLNRNGTCPVYESRLLRLQQESAKPSV